MVGIAVLFGVTGKIHGRGGELASRVTVQILCWALFFNDVIWVRQIHKLGMDATGMHLPSNSYVKPAKGNVAPVRFYRQVPSASVQLLLVQPALASHSRSIATCMQPWIVSSAT